MDESLDFEVRAKRSHRISVWAGLIVGTIGAFLGGLILVMGLMNNLTILNEAAFWFAVAALAFGLTANATRYDR